MDYITVFPPVDGQTEFCGNLIILSPGVISSKTNINPNSKCLLIRMMLQLPRQRTTIHLSTRGACYHNLPHKRVSQLIKFHHFLSTLPHWTLSRHITSNPTRHWLRYFKVWICKRVQCRLLQSWPGETPLQCPHSSCGPEYQPVDKSSSQRAFNRLLPCHIAHAKNIAI